MNVAVNGELFKEVEYIRCIGLKITVDGGIETEGVSRITDVGKVLGGRKVFSCRASR